MNKNLTLVLSILISYLLLCPLPALAGKLKLSLSDKGETMIFCNQIYKGNYLVVVRVQHNHPSAEYQYIFRYVMHTTRGYKIIFAKDLGFGIDSQIMNGTLLLANRDRTNNVKVSPASDLFIWIIGQASNVYLFHATESEVAIVFQDGEFRARYNCQDLDGDGFYEILAYDSTWHAIDDTRQKWANQMKGHPYAKLIYKFDGRKYILSEVVPDYESEKATSSRAR